MPTMERKKRKPTSWPERLKRLRERHGLTQTEAAEKVGTVLRTWQNWEYGRRTPSATTAKLIDLLFPED